MHYSCSMYILSIVILYYYRASKRTDKSKSWSSYREALEEVERQEAQIDKLKATLNNSKRNVERANMKLESLKEVKQSMFDQLESRKASLMEMTECEVSYDTTLKKAELDNQRKEEEIHVIDLKVSAGSNNVCICSYMSESQLTPLQFYIE